jgi:hypothetical protein
MPTERLPLTVVQILVWAAAHLQRSGRRPTGHSGTIPEAPGETWGAIDNALTNGYRGLRGGVSLVELLNRHWGDVPRSDKPPLTVEQIIAWAEAHHRRTGKWPTAASGPVEEAPEETWKRINAALWEGFRSLAGGDSLSRLLHRHRRDRIRKNS